MVENASAVDANPDHLEARSWRALRCRFGSVLSAFFFGAQLFRKLLNKVENELEDTANDVIDMMTNTLIPLSTDDEAKVLYEQMRGVRWLRCADARASQQANRRAPTRQDYFRYICEIKPNTDDNKERQTCETRGE